MPSLYDIDITQGSTLLLPITCRDSSNNYINFTGYSARGFVKYSYSNTGILLDLQPQIHSSYVSGLITLSGHATGTANLKPGVFVYDVEASGSDGYIFKPIMGYCHVSPECSI
jgi:hypothetical protein